MTKKKRTDDVYPILKVETLSQLSGYESENNILSEVRDRVESLIEAVNELIDIENQRDQNKSSRTKR
jgi:hypothetical protein